MVTGGLWVLVGEQFRCLSVGPEAAHHVGKGELQMARTGRERGRERERSRGRGTEAVTEGEAEHKLFSCSTTHHQNKPEALQQAKQTEQVHIPGLHHQVTKNSSLSLFLVFSPLTSIFSVLGVCVFACFSFFAVDRFVKLLVLVFFCFIMVEFVGLLSFVDA